MPDYRQTLTIDTIFGAAEVVFVPKHSIPDTPCPVGIFGTIPGSEVESHYLASFVDGDYMDIEGRHEAGHQRAFEDLIAQAASRYATATYHRHLADALTREVQPIPDRPAAVIADGSALWLDAQGNRLSRRTFSADETAVLVDLAKPVTRERCAEICEKFDVAVLHIYDWRYYHPVNGVELDEGFLREHGEEGSYNTEKMDYSYRHATDTLTVWKNDIPVFEDAAGVICDDRDALADSLL